MVWSGECGPRTKGIKLLNPGGGHPSGLARCSAREFRAVHSDGTVTQPSYLRRIPNVRHQWPPFRRCNCASPWRNGQKWADRWKCPRMGPFSVTARRPNVHPFGDGLFSALISNVTCGIDVFRTFRSMPVSGPVLWPGSNSVVRVRPGANGAMTVPGEYPVVSG